MQDVKTVLSKRLNLTKFSSFNSFLRKLRANPEEYAKLEAERLKPYLAAFSAQLMLDIGALASEDKKQAAFKRLKELSNTENLGGLFNSISERTGSTVLSEMFVTSEKTIDRIERTYGSGISTFLKTDFYNGRSLSMGFIQIFSEPFSLIRFLGLSNEEQSAKRQGVSAPILALDIEITKMIKGKSPDRIYDLLKDILTTGNHDMQHHYTNEIVNSNASSTRQMFTERSMRHRRGVSGWTDQYFSGAKSDNDIVSYESMLVMNHARIQNLLLEEEGGREALKAKCDTFFDELARIERKFNDKYKAHDTIDFLGTIACYALMRFLPLDDPLMEYCIERLKEVSPDPDRTLKDGRPSQKRLDDIKNFGDKDDLVSCTVKNYARKGRFILPESNNAEDMGFESVKKWQLINMAPHVTQLISPGKKYSVLGMSQERLARVNVDMLDASAHSLWFSPIKDGVWETVDIDGAKIKIHTKDGVPHNDHGAAIEYWRNEKDRKIFYCKNGNLHRNPKEGPAVIIQESADRVVEHFYKNGKHLKTLDVIIPKEMRVIKGDSGVKKT